MGNEGEGSSQRTCIKDPWTDNRARGLNVIDRGVGEWVGQGRVMGKNGDNCN